MPVMVFLGRGTGMTGRAARIASAVLLASLLPLAANATSEVRGAAADAAGSTGPTINQTAIVQRDADVAAHKNTLNVSPGGSFIRAAGAVVPAQITT
jgi:hypothetical protein